MMQAPSITVDGRAHQSRQGPGDTRRSFKGSRPPSTPTRAAGGYIVFTTNALSEGNHVLELTAVDGWIVVDHLVLHADDDAGSDQPVANAFHDDFKNGDITRWTTYGGNWSVSDGFYTCQADDGSKATRYIRQSFSDFLYQADIFVGKRERHVRRRRPDLSSSKPSVGTDAYYGYYAGIDVGQQRVVLGKAGNSWTLLSAYHLDPMSTHHLRVYATGSQITIVLDNIPVIRFSDDTYHSGAVGIQNFHIDAGWARSTSSHP